MATVTHFLDTRRTDIGSGIVKLRITHNRIQKDYSTKIKIDTTLYEKIKKQGSEINGRIKDRELINYHNKLYGVKDDINIYADGFIVRAKTIIKKLGDNFDFDVFKDEFDNYGKEIKVKDSKTDVIKALLDKGASLVSNGQFTHGKNFEFAAKSLNRFIEYQKIHYPNKIIPKKNFVLQYEHIDKDFLNAWSNWMKQFGKAPQKKDGTPSPASETTIGIYSRTLRILFNDAIAEKTINEDNYPFGAKKYIPPAGRNIKKALTSQELTKIKEYLPESNTLEQRSHDLWLFSYYGNGMNFTDILYLKWENIIESKYILFQRRKTRGTPSTIRVKLNETMIATIERWGTENKSKSSYVFPILQDITKPDKQKAEIKQTIKLTNKYMNRIAEKLEISGGLNTYHARHSFATQLMRSNAPLSMIKDMLGHQKITTTENYLGSFEEEVENEYLSML
ncbi:tyrosine-type recombinase/integrase [Emticicia fluvialis]|uniref:tyrosine-type recombinase/integrase n=1 Tax=Emticicia fluvialis TaxID=2974474 RepID=UPI002165C20F|nr:site-specific integrase [Emticicia fluvialis]